VAEASGVETAATSHTKTATGNLFTLVQNWAVVETRRLFYEYAPDETVGMWEVATMAVLELRKAMLQAVNNAPPTLAAIIDGLGVHTNIPQKDLMSWCAPLRAAGNKCEDLPPATDVHESDVRMWKSEPCFFFASSPLRRRSTVHFLPTENGVEGVYLGFPVAIFFQMKLYGASTPKQIQSWLEAAHTRAQQLRYKEGDYVVQLFVTGATEANLTPTIWPKNSMVFSTPALQALFGPFGAGFITHIIAIKGTKQM
jgi:hypothetical protein